MGANKTVESRVAGWLALQRVSEVDEMSRREGLFQGCRDLGPITSRVESSMPHPCRHITHIIHSIAMPRLIIQ